MDFAFNEEQRMLQKMFRDFVANEVAPLAEETDHEEKPPLELLPKAAMQGFLGALLPEEFEGVALTHIQIKRDGRVIFESDPISPGSLDDGPDYTGEIEYRLVVWAVADAKSNQRIIVIVKE